MLVVERRRWNPKVKEKWNAVPYTTNLKPLNQKRGIFVSSVTRTLQDCKSAEGAEPAQLRRLECSSAAQKILVLNPTNAYLQVCGRDWLGCHAGCQEVSLASVAQGPSQGHATWCRCTKCE